MNKEELLKFNQDIKTKGQKGRMIRRQKKGNKQDSEDIQTTVN